MPGKSWCTVNDMKVIITGTSSGIGRGIAEEFLRYGDDVIGIDICASTIQHENYTYFVSNSLSQIYDCARYSKSSLLRFEYLK